jgi:Fic family protein
MLTFNELLKEFTSSGIPEAVNFEQMNEILISHHSTAIEGSSLTEEETRLLLSEGLTAKGKPMRDHNMVQDHHAALLFAIGKAKKKEKISGELIRQLSALVMKTTGGIINSAAGTYNSAAGDFRKSAVYVGKRFFMNYQKVPDAVDALCDDINQRLEAVKTPEEIYNLAFDAHFALVSIHPFADGNGRVSRLLMNYILTFHQQPLSVIFTEDKLQYYEALEQSREADDVKFIRDFLYSQQKKYFLLELAKLKTECVIKPRGFCF